MRRPVAIIAVLIVALGLAGCGGSSTTSTTAVATSTTTADPAALPSGPLVVLAVLDEPTLVILDTEGGEVRRLQTPDGAQLRTLYQPPGGDIAVGVTQNGYVFVIDVVELSIVDGGGLAPTPRFYPLVGFGDATADRFVMEFPEDRLAAIIATDDRTLAGRALAEFAPGELYLVRMNQPGTAMLVSTEVGEWLIDLNRQPLAGIFLEATGAFTPAGDELLLVQENGEVTRTSVGEPFGGEVVATGAVAPVGLVGENVVHGVAGGGLRVVGGAGDTLDGDGGNIGLAVAPDGSGAVAATADRLFRITASGEIVPLEDLAGFRVSVAGSQALFSTDDGGRFAVVSIATGEVLATGDEPSAVFHTASADGRWVGVQAFAAGAPLSLLIDVQSGRVEELAGRALVSPYGSHVTYLTAAGPVVAPLDDPAATTVLGPPGSVWWINR